MRYDNDESPVVKLGFHQEQLPAASTYEDELHCVEINELISL